MRTNKLFAGALALALGLGAVAPTYATSGKGVLDADYRKAEAKFVEEFNEKVALEKAVADATVKRDEAKKAFEAQQLVVKGLEDELVVLNKKIEKYQADIKTNEEKIAALADNTGEASDKVDAERQVEGLIRTNENLEALIKGIKEVEIPALEEKIDDAKDMLEDKSRDLSEASRLLKVAEDALAADEGYEDAKKAFLLAGVDKNIIDQAEKSGTYVKPEDKEEDKKEVTAAQIKALEEAIFNNKVQAKAAEILLEKNPKAVASFKAELEKELAKSKEAVAKATKLLEALQKKTSLLDAVVLTSYAAEDKKEEEKPEEAATSEDVDALIKELDTNTENISKLLEKAEEEADKPAEDKKEEEKPAEDKKEDKKEEVKPVENKKAASTNAKTGVVGVAGVGAVLAAASAAYVSSKRR